GTGCWADAMESRCSKDRRPAASDEREIQSNCLGEVLTPSRSYPSFQRRILCSQPSWASGSKGVFTSSHDSHIPSLKSSSSPYTMQLEVLHLTRWSYFSTKHSSQTW